MGGVLIVLGWLALILGNLIWIGHGIYQLITTEQGFFTVVATNGLYWLLQMGLALFALVYGYGIFKGKKNK